VIEAAWRGYPRIVKSLIDNGANLNATDGTGKIAVMWAAINGHAPVIMNLLAAGAPLDERDKEGLSALMRAAWNGYADAVRALLAAKANTGGVRQTARSYNHGLFIWECRKPTHAL
jgi:ankyrin repeat protein